ncbi:MAG TPA: hypothetical protein VF533_08485 [Solirubrobacteraceae bacterium]|jgi:hypothetical protein
MRTTLTLADDVAAAVERLRRERSLGMSEAVNELVRAGLASQAQPRTPFRQRAYDLGSHVNVDNVAEVLDALDER